MGSRLKHHEYASKSDLLKTIDSLTPLGENDSSVSKQDVVKAINTIKTERDVVKVVRCRDCIYDDTIQCFLCYIEKHTLTWINHDGNFFCGKGRSKTGVEP